MSTRTIYDALRAAGLTREGACGLMGNMQAESSMKSNIVQRGMTAMSDEEYTEAADMGRIDFAHDSIGYGLCQWTFYSRKAALLDFARTYRMRSAYRESVGNEEMQVAFCIQEMRENFPNVWRVLTSSWDLYECTRIVCIQYERPAVNNVDARFAFARQFMEQFPDEPEDTGSSQESGESDLAVAMLQLLMREGGCWDREIDGVKSPAFREKIREYADDVASC